MACLNGYLLLWSSKFRIHSLKRLRRYLCAFLVCVLVYSNVGWVYTEIAFAVQMHHFRYPLDVDMVRLVEDISDGKEPSNVQPLNTIDPVLILEGDDICSDKYGDDLHLLLLIVVKSKVDNFDQRSAIRDTWGAQHLKYDGPVKVVFLLGTKPGSKGIQQQVLSEQKVHRDLVQGDFVDHYYNNTIKLLVGLRWVTTQCTHSKYIAFVDDDFFIVPQQIINTAMGLQYEDFMFGYLWRIAYPFRNSLSKWAISEEEYPYTFWPSYLLGGCFVTPFLTARKLSIASRYTKLLRFDDVYLGIIAHKLRIRLLHQKEIYYSRSKFPGMKKKGTSVVAVHDYTPSELRQVWREYLEIVQT